ncbi:MAG: hypothetical protein AB1916_14355 [Thermodesulfobacteriota bacterium]
MPKRPISERIRWFLDLALKHGEEFAAPEAVLARQRHRAQHPTAILALKCMDGRVHLTYATETPQGVIEPFRNLGGMFDLGWPYLGEVITDSVARAVAQGRRVLMLLTYHFSAGDPHRGCAGFGNDTHAAMRHVVGVRDQVEQVFGQHHGTVYPLVVGFETDEDALILHGPSGFLNLAAQPDASPGRLDAELAALLPDMPGPMRADLLPLVLGNVRHIAEIRALRRTPTIDHTEWALCVGRGFDFLHQPGAALIVGPYSPDLADPVRKAAGIIRSNMEGGRIPDDGFLLLASTPWREPGPDRARAELKSRFLYDFTAGVIAQADPDLARKMVGVCAVMHWEARRLEVIHGPTPAGER